MQGRQLAFQELGGTFDLPECLLITKREGNTASTFPLYVQAQGWVAAEGVKPMGPVYDVSYFKYASNEMGIVRVLIPQSSASEAEVVEWAKKLPPMFLPFFQNRSTSVALPALPGGGPK